MKVVITVQCWSSQLDKGISRSLVKHHFRECLGNNLCWTLMCALVHWVGMFCSQGRQTLSSQQWAWTAQGHWGKTLVLLMGITTPRSLPFELQALPSSISNCSARWKSHCCFLDFYNVRLNSYTNVFSSSLNADGLSWHVSITTTMQAD